MIVKEDGLPVEHETIYMIREGLKGTPYHRVKLNGCRWEFLSEKRRAIVASENDQWFDNYGEAAAKVFEKRFKDEHHE